MHLVSIVFLIGVSLKCVCSIPTTLPQSGSNDNSTSELNAPEFKQSATSGSLRIRAGNRFKINCPVKGKPKPAVRFWRDDRLLERSKHFAVSSTFLRIDRANLDDAGIYRCTATNAAGNVSKSFRVEIYDDSSVGENGLDSENPVSSPKGGKAPHWTNSRKMEKRLHAEPAGNTVMFRCTASGEEPLDVSWFKDGEAIEKDQRVGGFKFRHKKQLIQLTSVVVSDEGMYKCVVSNSYGSINHTYELDVQERSAAKPILQGMSNQSVIVGSDATLRCEVYSDAHPHVQWIKWYNESLKHSYTVLKENYDLDGKYEKAGVNTTEEEMQTLSLKNVSFADAGIYTCLAGNSIGLSHKSAWLTVLPAPGPTEDPDLQNETHYLMFIFGGIVVVIVVFFVVYMCKSHYENKDPPRLVPIQSLDRPMTKMEEPVMLFGNEQAWRRMCLPNADHIEINIQPDLQWELKKEDIHLKDRIDEGFFGQVFRADLITCLNAKKEKLDAAVKMLKGTRTEKDMLDLLTEMDQMKRIGKHKNIINLLGVCTQNGILWLVTEYAQQGNLRDYLRRNRPIDMQYHLVDPNAPNAPNPRSQPLSYKDLMSAAFQVARGMDYLAQKKCVHRDLAARNVLVTDEYVMKIADFGLARDIRCNDYYRKNTRGHLPYKWMALEAMSDNVFTHATDVWSFGVLLWEIFTLGGSPYPGVKTNELVRFLRNGARLDHPQFSSPELYRLMKDCWEELPQKRPKFRQLVEDLDRMLAKSSSEDYIDLGNPMHDYSLSESEDDDDDSSESSPHDSANGTAEDDDVSDSVFDEPPEGAVNRNQGNHDYVDDELGPLLRQDSVLCNGHARIASDV